MKAPSAAPLVSMLKKIPGVVVTSKLNSTNFTLGNKVFAFTKGSGVVLKLPPETVSRLLESKRASRLVMGKRTMKEWVVVPLGTLKDPGEHLPLFREAMAYATGGKT